MVGIRGTELSRWWLITSSTWFISAFKKIWRDVKGFSSMSF
jgi:hypothetical protein